MKAYFSRPSRRVRVACYRANGPPPNPHIPHGNTGCNVLYYDGSARFRPRPPSGWGEYSWIPGYEVGNTYDDMPFWDKAHAAY